MGATNNEQTGQRVNADIYVLFSNYYNYGFMPQVNTLSRIIAGGEISSADTIKVAQENDKYFIVIPANELANVDPAVWFNNVVSIFASNLPNTVVNFSILSSMSDTQLEKGPIIDEQTFEDARIFAMLHETFQFCLKASTKFDYSVSSQVRPIVDALMTATKIKERRPRPEYEETDLPPYPVGSANDFMSKFLNDEDDSGHKKKKKKKKAGKKELKYATSRVLKCAKSPKKAYKRHGVLVCKDKDAIKRDCRIIKDFIEEFIPGNAGWKKDLRKDLLDRWVQVYVISTKRLKRLERERRRNIVRNRRDADVQRTIDVTRKLFNVPIDRWNDPTK